MRVRWCGGVGGEGDEEGDDGFARDVGRVVVGEELEFLAGPAVGGCQTGFGDDDDGSTDQIMGGWYMGERDGKVGKSSTDPSITHSPFSFVTLL